MDANLTPALFALFCFYEVANLLYETRKQRSYSIIYKLIIAAKTRTRINDLYKYDEFRLIAGIDTYGSLSHMVSILLLAFLGSSLFALQWFKIFQMAIVGVSLSIVLWDLIFWTSKSIHLYFESLSAIAAGRLAGIRIAPNDSRKLRAKSLYDRVRYLRLGDLIPSFVMRFMLVIVIVILAFSFQYVQLSNLDRYSFVGPSGAPVTDFPAFLYQSVMMTTAFGTNLQLSRWSELIIGFHALTSLYLLVIALAFFGTLSESSLEKEKSNFLSRFKELVED